MLICGHPSHIFTYPCMYWASHPVSKPLLWKRQAYGNYKSLDCNKILCKTGWGRCIVKSVGNKRIVIEKVGHMNVCKHSPNIANFCIFYIKQSQWLNEKPQTPWVSSPWHGLSLSCSFTYSRGQNKVSVSFVLHSHAMVWMFAQNGSKTLIQC